MTTLAHNAVVLEVNVDTGRLFDDGGFYSTWVDQLVDRVALSRREAIDG